jgi:photosystem I reaction center subunit PsaK
MEYIFSALLDWNAEPTAVESLGRLPTIPVMAGACLFALWLGSRTIKYPNVGPKMPLGPLAPLFKNISVPAFIASMSFGHILGVLAVMGLSSPFR